MEHTAEALSAIRRAQTERAPLLGIPVQGTFPFHRSAPDACQLREAISRIRAIDKAQDVVKARKREQEPLSLASLKRRNRNYGFSVNLTGLYKLLSKRFPVNTYSSVKRTRHGNPEPSFATYFHHLYHYCCGLRLKPDALKLHSYRYQRLFEGSAEQMKALQADRCEYIKHLRDYEYFQGQLQQLKELLADYQRQAEAEAQAAA